MVFFDGSCVSFLFMAKSFCPIMHFFVYFLLLDCRIWRHLENEQLRRRRDYQYYIYKVSEFKIYPKRACSGTLKVYCITFFIHCVEFIYPHRRIVKWSTMVLVYDLDHFKFWIWLNKKTLTAMLTFKVYFMRIYVEKQKKKPSDLIPVILLKID